MKNKSGESKERKERERERKRGRERESSGEEERVDEYPVYHAFQDKIPATGHSFSCFVKFATLLYLQ